MLICNVRRFEHIIPIAYRIKFKILLLTFKALNGLVLEYISELLELRITSRYNLRSSKGMNIEHSKVKSKATHAG